MLRTFLSATLLSTSAALLAVSAAPAIAETNASAQSAIARAVDSPERPDAERQRDQFRHPKETLAFFGVTPDMMVIEITPGAGWYTEILGPLLAEDGEYMALIPAGADSANYRARIEKNKARYGNIELVEMSDGANDLPQSEADVILTFRNVHNWVMAGTADKMFAQFYRALKSGGVLGVVDHRLPEDRKETKETQKSGYVKQSTVIALAKAAGFKLEAESEINANPRDTADHPAGVWSLPPTYALKDENRDHFTAIGESDRMTLKFVKPKL